MRHRIGIWASAGFLVAGCWTIYAFAGAIPITSDPIVWTLARLTCPVVLVGFYFHFGIYFYWVLLTNAGTYALIGLIVETLWQRLHHPK